MRPCVALAQSRALRFAAGWASPGRDARPRESGLIVLPLALTFSLAPSRRDGKLAPKSGRMNMSEFTRRDLAKGMGAAAAVLTAAKAGAAPAAALKPTHQRFPDDFLWGC